MKPYYTPVLRLGQPYLLGLMPNSDCIPMSDLSTRIILQNLTILSNEDYLLEYECYEIIL